MKTFFSHVVMEYEIAEPVDSHSFVSQTNLIERRFCRGKFSNLIVFFLVACGGRELLGITTNEY